MRIAFSCSIFAVLTCLAGSASGARIVYYEQSTAGSPAGELFVEGLAEGPLRIRTPSHPGLHVGIKRMDSSALIRFVDHGGTTGATELRTVLEQADSEFPFIFALVIEDKRNILPDSETGPAASGPTPLEPRLPSPVDVKQAAPAESRAPGQAKASAASDVDDESGPPAPASAVCPTLIVPPGSLYAATARLASECGYALGAWNPGDDEILLDFETDDLKAVDNSNGVQGLLALLRSEYGLIGVVRHGTKLIDIYEYKTETAP